MLHKVNYKYNKLSPILSRTLDLYLTTEDSSATPYIDHIVEGQQKGYSLNFKIK